MGISISKIFYFLFVILLPAMMTAQKGKSGIFVSTNYIITYGEYSDLKPNQKIVNTDIQDNWSLGMGYSYYISKRTSLRLSYLFNSNYTLEHNQVFPDETSFSTSSNIRYSSVLLGIQMKVLSSGLWKLIIEPSIMLAFYRDFTLDVAGLPFDRQEPYDIRSKNTPGAGLLIANEFSINQNLYLSIHTGVMVNRFQGTFKTEDEVEMYGDIDLPFNPLMFSLGMTKLFANKN